jgi:hypothetical protein
MYRHRKTGTLRRTRSLLPDPSTPSSPLQLPTHHLDTCMVKRSLPQPQVNALYITKFVGRGPPLYLPPFLPNRPRGVARQDSSESQGTQGCLPRGSAAQNGPPPRLHCPKRPFVVHIWPSLCAQIDRFGCCPPLGVPQQNIQAIRGRSDRITSVVPHQ